MHSDLHGKDLRTRLKQIDENHPTAILVPWPDYSSLRLACGVGLGCMHGHQLLLVNAVYTSGATVATRKPIAYTIHTL